MLAKILKISFITFVTFVSTVIILFSLLTSYLFSPGPLAQETVVIIPKSSTKKISLILQEKNIIQYPYIFEWSCKIFHYFGYISLKSGEYKFTTKITPLQIIDILNSGKSILHKLTIPEGYTVQQILDILDNNNLLVGEINSIVPEGYLMPSTYYYSYGDQKEIILDIMRSKMSASLDILMPKLSSSSPIKTRKELLILASIIEKEAGSNEEKPTIAAVFINRLKKKMKLQADPTTSYAITQGKYILPRSLTKKDLAIESEYNTYYVPALPSGAISCPGTKSLEAVVFPAEVDYLYFVVDGNGGHNFSSNLQDHNKNVAAYRMRQKQVNEK